MSSVQQRNANYIGFRYYESLNQARLKLVVWYKISGFRLSRNAEPCLEVAASREKKMLFLNVRIRLELLS